MDDGLRQFLVPTATPQSRFAGPPRRPKSGARVKDRVRRIRAEVKKIPGSHIWVTGAREIENYLPGAVLEKALGGSFLPDPTQYDPFFPRKRESGNSYVEKQIGRMSLDKMDLAVTSAPHMTMDLMSDRFDWLGEMVKIVERIKTWNR